MLGSASLTFSVNFTFDTGGDPVEKNTIDHKCIST